MSLDKKLKKLLSDDSTIKHCCGQSDCNDIPSDIAQIKQAFVDDGWVKVPQVELEHDPSNTRPTLYTVMGQEVMTGQQWYDRFKKELELEYGIERYPAYQAYRKATIAARKASGIDK